MDYQSLFYNSITWIIITISSYTIVFAHNIVPNKVTTPKKRISQIQLNKLHAIAPTSFQKKKKIQFLRWLHSPITKDSVIFNLLPFKVGDAITEEALIEAKNILCQTPYFKKVDISTQLVEESSDLLVVKIATTDAFRIDGNIFKSMLQYNNLFGRGHIVYNHFFLPIVSGHLGYGIQYEIPMRQNMLTMALQGYRKDGVEGRYRFRYFDLFIRKDLAFHLSDTMKSSTLFTSAKYIFKSFLKIPPPRQDNRLYHDYQFFIGSIGIQKERYYECEQVFTQLSKDVIPFGNMITATAGYQIGQYVNRWYMAIDLSKGRYIDYIGHLFGQIAIGGFLNQKKYTLEQGALKMHIGYFTPLLKTRWNRFRSFINMIYVVGYNRFARELLGVNEVQESEEMDDPPSPSDPYSYLPKGSSRINVHYRNIFFIPMIFHGFKIALVYYIDLVSLHGLKNDTSFQNNSICREYGVGIQLEKKKFLFLHDFNLVIKTGYCPMIHTKAPLQFGLNIDLLPNFKRQAPAIIPYY